MRFDMSKILEILCTWFVICRRFWKFYTRGLRFVEDFGNFIHVMCDVFKRYTCAISPGMIFGIAGFLKYGWLEIM